MASSVRELAEQAKERKNFLLSAKIELPLRNGNPEPLKEDEAKKLRDAIWQFRALTEHAPLEAFYSKFRFVNDWDSASVMSQELLLRLLSDRNFYFSEYRDLGNLRAGPDGVHPAPRLKGVFFDSAGEILRLASMSPKDLLKEALEKIKPCADEGTEDARQQESRLAAAVCDALLQFMDPEPQTIVVVDVILRLAKEKYHSNDANEPTQAECEPFPDAAAEQMLAPYQAIVENHRRAQQTIKDEWLPTNIHRQFYYEMEENYEALQQAIQQRQDEISAAERLIAGLNSLGNAYPRTAKTSLPVQYDKVVDQLTELFERYVRSVLHDLHKQEYLPILTHAELPPEQKPYREVIARLLACCVQDDGLHPLSRLFFYSAFSENTKVILQGADQKRKPVRKTKRKIKPVAVYKMASMTGYRAGLNLVLYHELKGIFGSYGSVCLLGREGRAVCEKTPHADATIGRRIQPDQCFSEGKTGCPFVRTCEAWNDWGFALISGYGFLFHHKAEIGVTYEVPYDEIFVTREEQQIHKTGDVRQAPQPAANTKKYSIMKYTMNLDRPVGKLEGLLRQHVQNCIQNRPRFLTPQIAKSHMYSADPFVLPYEELAFILLQDAHLPAMQRVIRRIKKLVSENPDYLQKYDAFLQNVLGTTSREISGFLNEIVEKHGLRYQVPRYSSYKTSNRSYNIDAALCDMLEYELRSLLYEQQQEKLIKIIRKTLSSELFLYENFIQQPRVASQSADKMYSA